QVGQLLGGLQSALVGIGSTIVAVAVNLSLVLVIGFLWLVTSARLKAFVVDLLPLHQQELARQVFAEMGLHCLASLSRRLLRLPSVRRTR
ncbi:MAG: hypothetical protein ACREQ5_39115, partial [Candidatus Dormibacteria bacterium]